MVRIIWSQLAIDDLKSIHEYIATESQIYANSTVAKILIRVSQLASFPQSGRIVPEFGEITIRELIEGNYRIVYKVNPHHIGIVRIHHSARLLSKI